MHYLTKALNDHGWRVSCTCRGDCSCRINLDEFFQHHVDKRERERMLAVLRYAIPNPSEAEEVLAQYEAAMRYAEHG